MSDGVLVEDYLSAYEAANDKAPDYRLTYEAGWFPFLTPSGDIVAMTKRLRAVAGAKAAGDGPEARAFGP